MDADTVWLCSHSRHPTEAGWYPVVIMWDAYEGGFPSAERWTGSEWGTRNPVIMFAPTKYLRAQYAVDMARRNDPDL